MTSPLAPRRNAPHFVPRLILVGFFVSIAIWFGIGGYERFTAPNPRWALPNGDTVEILLNENEYSAGVQLAGSPHAEAEHYLWIRFRSPLTDSVLDYSDIRAIVDVTCRSADSLGFRKIKIEPTRGEYFDFLKYSQGSQTYVVESGGRCHA